MKSFSFNKQNKIIKSRLKFILFTLFIDFIIPCFLINIQRWFGFFFVCVHKLLLWNIHYYNYVSNHKHSTNCHLQLPNKYIKKEKTFKNTQHKFFHAALNLFAKREGTIYLFFTHKKLFSYLNFYTTFLFPRKFDVFFSYFIFWFLFFIISQMGKIKY